MASEPDPIELMQAMSRARRRRVVGAVLAFLVVVVLGLAVGAVFRDRTVYVVGGPDMVGGRISDHAGFRAQWPFIAIYELGPGTHAISNGRGPIRSEIRVPFAPWVSKVVAPAQEGQCLIVADGGGFYGDAPMASAYVHGFTTRSEEIALPMMFSDRVVSDPCRLPRAVRLTETVAVILSVPCDQAPHSADEAARLVMDRWHACGGT